MQKSVKLAVDFTIEVRQEIHKELSGKETRHEVQFESGGLASDNYYMSESVDFDSDIIDAFVESDEFSKMLPGKTYFVFQYGEATADDGYSEYGYEFNGWIFEPSVTVVSELPGTGE